MERDLAYPCYSMERDYAHECHNGCFLEFCNTLVSGEAREFIDNHDQDTLLDSTFPSKNITIAELMMLQSKFGPILASDIIGKVSSSKVDQNFKVFIGRKIIFVKKGMKHFKRYTGKHQGVPAESISYRRWDLEEFTQASITSQKESSYWFSSK